MFLIYEGVDKVGKGTIEQLMNKRHGYQFVNIDRGPLGFIAYDKIYDRLTEDRLRIYEKEWNLIKNNCLVIYLYASEETSFKRILEHNEEMFNKGSLTAQAKIYKEVIDEYTTMMNCVEICTDSITPEAVCEIIENKLKWIDEVGVKGRILSEEVYRENGKYVQYKAFSQDFDFQDMKKLGVYNESIDRYYYEALRADIMEQLNKFKVGFNGKRQIVHVSNDCISFVQIKMPREEGDKLHIYVFQRSMDLENHDMNDILFFDDLVLKMIEEEFLDTMYRLEYVVHYNVSFPHRYLSGGGKFGK